jgi:succinoglycan biosynthesis transport protein ExoP
MQVEKSLGISDYIAALRRRRRLAALIGVPILVIGCLVSVTLPSVYSSTAVFKLNEDPEAKNNADSYLDQYVSGLSYAVLTGQNLNKLLDIYPVILNGGNRQTALKQIMRGTRVDMVTEKILDPQSGREKVINTGFTVSADSRNPDVAWKTATWLTDEFINASRQEALAHSGGEVKFFTGEADRLRERISTLESQLADFKRKNFDQLPETAQSNLNIRSQTEQELDQLAREISTQEQNRIFVLQQLQQAQQTGVGAANLQQLEEEYRTKSASYAEDHPDMIALRRQIDRLKHGGTVGDGGSLQAQLETQRSILAEARQRYSEDHPDIKRIQKSIASLEARIASGERSDSSVVTSPLVAQLRTQANGIDSQIASAQSRAAELRAKRSQLDTHLASTPQVEREFQTLTRDLGTARAQYDALMNHRMDADVKSAAILAGESDKFTLIESANKPQKPAKPSRIGIALAGLMAALIFALTGTVAAEAVDPTVRGTRDLRSVLSEMPLSVIPKIQNSIYRRQQTKKAFVAVVSLVVSVPILFVLIRALVN